MRVVLPLALAALLAPVTAQACGVDPVPGAVIFGRKPSDVPTGSEIVRARALAPQDTSYVRVLKVIEGPAALKNRDIRVIPSDVSSCTTLGRDEGYLVIQRASEDQPPDMFVAMVFGRGWLDYVFAFFGMEPYLFPGSRA